MSMLRTIREKKGFTLGQLAGRAGISARVLADYEEGRQALNLAHAKLLAKALWVGIEELIPPPGAVVAQPTPAATPAAHAEIGPHAAVEQEATQTAQPQGGGAGENAGKGEARGAQRQG